MLLQGPTDTPFEAGTFELSINVPEQYPLVPPAVRFKTKIFHPNVHFKVCFKGCVLGCGLGHPAGAEAGPAGAGG